MKYLNFEYLIYDSFALIAHGTGCWTVRAHVCTASLIVLFCDNSLYNSLSPHFLHAQGSKQHTAEMVKEHFDLSFCFISLLI